MFVQVMGPEQLFLDSIRQLWDLHVSVRHGALKLLPHRGGGRGDDCLLHVNRPSINEYARLSMFIY